MPPTRTGAQHDQPPRVLGRYALYEEIASGGMATVHLARLLGTAGFSRTVAIKRLHPHLARDPEFVTMFLDEARLAARVQNPNVVPTLDVVAADGELFLVMEYVQGESLQRLLRTLRARHQPMDAAVAVTIACGVLQGLHAAHEAKNERGEPLGLVHRDVSPHNILIGSDGVARLLDFGIAKAMGRLQSTGQGQIKGKIAYMAPEQMRHGEVSRRTDIFAASIVLWEMLAGRPLFEASNEGELVLKMLDGTIERLRAVRPEVAPRIEALLMRGLERDPGKRFATAEEMAHALEEATEVRSPAAVARWLRSVAEAALAERARLVERVESVSFRDEAHLASLVVQPSGAARDFTPTPARVPALPSLYDTRSAEQAETVTAPRASDSGTRRAIIAQPARTPRSRNIFLALAALCVVGAAGMLWRLRTLSPTAADAPPQAASGVSAMAGRAIATVPPIHSSNEASTQEPTAQPSASASAVAPRSTPRSPTPTPKPAAPSPPAASARPEDFFGRD